MPLRDYFNSFNFYRTGELSRNHIDKSGAQVKKESETFTVLCSRFPQNLFWSFWSSCCFKEDGKEMFQDLKPTCRANVFLIKPIGLAALSRRRRRCLSSLQYPDGVKQFSSVCLRVSPLRATPN